MLDLSFLKGWEKTKEFQAHLQEAQELIKQALATHKKMYVAFSGGKDSTCMLHLVLQQQPDILVWHWDYGRYISRDFEKEIIRNMYKIGAKNIKISTSKAYQNHEKVFYRVFWGRVVPWFIKKGFDGVFVGLRKEESFARRERILNNKKITKLDECWPLKNWTWRDIWTYIYINNLPIHTAYYKYVPVLGIDKTRFATFFDPEFETLGAPNIDGILLWRWKNEQI